MVKKENVPYGSDVSAGTYECVDCGHRYSNRSKSSLPPCPNVQKSNHRLKGWRIVSGAGDAAADPQGS